MEKTFQGKVAVVTGGTRGIGRAISATLLERGASVVALYAQDDEAAREFIGSVFGKEGAVAMKADITDEAAIKGAFDQVLSRFGRIDFLVNNAGIVRDSLVVRMKEADWHAVLDVHLTGTFRCTRLAARAMLRQKEGAIVNICSVVAELGNVGQANYVAAKAGMIGFTKATARELAPRGITVNAVAPGWIETEMTKSLPQKVRDRWLDLIPLGRLGQPEEVAALVSFLLSDKGRYITGQLIHINGGLYM